MKRPFLSQILTGSAIALSLISFNLAPSRANPNRPMQTIAAAGKSLTGQWVMGSIDPNPKVRQEMGKLGLSVTQNGTQVRVQPQVGIPMIGQISGHQIRVPFLGNQNIQGFISNDGNRVLLTRPGENQPTGALVRVGSPGCPNQGNWNNTIQSCQVR